MKNDFGGCPHHEVWTKDCLGCNNTDSCIFFTSVKRCKHCLGDGWYYMGDGMMIECLPCGSTGEEK